MRPDQAVAGREASEILQAALQKLSPDLREAVILRDLQEMEYREIAQVLAIPEGTVKSRINRGRAELARLLRKQKLACMNCADAEILICDYVDGTLDAGRKAELERHLAACPACAELARDSAAAVAFLDRVAAEWSRRLSWSTAFCSPPHGPGESRSSAPGWKPF